MLQISPILQDNLALEQATSFIHSHTFLFFPSSKTTHHRREGKAACTPTLYARIQIPLNNDLFIDYLTKPSNDK